jgi:choline-sulfatase
LIFQGAGIAPGKRLRAPASILDIGPTLCGLVGADTPPCQDGVSLVPGLRDGVEDAGRAVLSEWVQYHEGRPIAARMLRAGRWKLMHYRQESIPDQLFDIETDPDELNNRAGDRPDTRRELLARLAEGWDPDGVAARFEKQAQHHALLARSHRAFCLPEPEAETRPVPDAATARPEIIV